MKLCEVQELLQAEVLSREDLLTAETDSCFGGDLMSDVLAFTERGTLLCTSLTNGQVVRTADMSELAAVVFVLGKRPAAEVTEAAASSGLVTMTTKRTLFEACGILYAGGLRSCCGKEKP
ncbi:MAG: hypothetical protein SPI71_00560 [Acidaminococcaceae bacterium]|nr:hypothetical protein [Acidaminococcaceae bacterium]